MNKDLRDDTREGDLNFFIEIKSLKDGQVDGVRTEVSLRVTYCDNNWVGADLSPITISYTIGDPTITFDIPGLDMNPHCSYSRFYWFVADENNDFVQNYLLFVFFRNHNKYKCLYGNHYFQPPFLKYFT